MTLTKAELVDILVDKVSNVTKNDAKEIVELFLKKSAALWQAAKKSKFPVSKFPVARQAATPVP